MTRHLTLSRLRMSTTAGDSPTKSATSTWNTLAVGGVAQSIVKKAFTWANTMPQFKDELLMHTILDQDKLVFTSKGITVVACRSVRDQGW